MSSDTDEMGGDTEEEVMTAAEVLEKLEEAWLNEKFSPDLLETKTDLVECMLEQITAMEENIQRAKKGDFKISIHRMEIDRIRYVLSSYLRIRLKKIEDFTAYILHQESQRKEEDSPLLSPEEYKFAKEYQTSVEGHFNSLALRHMPANSQTLDPKLTVIQPNLDNYIFLRVNEDTQGILIEEETLDTGEEIVDLEKGDQHIMRYRPLAPHVASSAVSLI
ncbi:DNA replication complex GINS protein SLD5 isoform X1 [Patella vulgata]|uniref:DNA replication complex GINS protein SLD5 isoform X1 n=1 Tax=Patella vulgata TaxID=6465 RepID=UPI0021808040|nr:DNA replication complex GINS protein SLD5 isoform X1 [Patella vulgata]